MSPLLITVIGAVAQLLFSARILVQWIASEKAHKILSPVLFWQLSMVASFMLCLYGWLRNDFAIVAGQLVAFYIYIWNLRTKGAWNNIPTVLRYLFAGIPVIAAVWCVFDWDHTMDHLFRQENIPPLLIIFGTVGQTILTFRFIYQWLYSRRRGESLLPVNFWIISLTGASMMVVYSVIRHDPIYLIGQASGAVVYSRNIMIGLKNRRKGLPEIA